ncbi:MAG TPA: class I SAM-dependent methyltransferase [Pseudomonadota bacterium]|nr:class I SAM-dependent methyltransferase [Pseudomonadota bacterium]
MNSAIQQNEQIYDNLWAQLPIPSHTEWPIWPELEREMESGARFLEIGGGVLPRIPIPGGFFVDLSQAALFKLGQLGGFGVRSAGSLPFSDGAFDVLCAFEVLEHIPDDDATLREISRVLRPGGAFFFSVPVAPDLWTDFDAACGHVRRYVARDLSNRIRQLGLHIERWTTQPNNFGKVSGKLAGTFLRAAAGFPRFTLWLKSKAVQGEKRLILNWRTDDIQASHKDGGLIAIARKVV